MRELNKIIISASVNESIFNDNSFRYEREIGEEIYQPKKIINQTSVIANPVQISTPHHNHQLVESNCCLENPKRHSGNQQTMQVSEGYSYLKQHDETVFTIMLVIGYVALETQGFRMAIQHRVMRSRNYQKHCLKLQIEDKSRKWKVAKSIKKYS